MGYLFCPISGIEYKVRHLSCDGNPNSITTRQFLHASRAHIANRFARLVCVDPTTSAAFISVHHRLGHHWGSLQPRHDSWRWPQGLCILGHRVLCHSHHRRLLCGLALTCSRRIRRVRVFTGHVNCVRMSLCFELGSSPQTNRRLTAAMSNKSLDRSHGKRVSHHHWSGAAAR